MFDVEAVFIFPWATRLEQYGLFGLVEMAIFIFILLLGLLYAWRKRYLNGPKNFSKGYDMGLVESGKMPKSLTKLLNMSRLLNVGISMGTSMLRN